MKVVSIYIILLLSTYILHAQSFELLINTNEDENFLDMVETGAGDFIMGGRKGSYADSSDAYLVKISSEGILEQEKRIKVQGNNSYIRSLISITDTTFLSFGYNGDGLWLLLFDDNLNIIKEKIYKGEAGIIWQTAGKVIRDSRDNIVMVGNYTRDTSQNAMDELVLYRFTTGGDSISTFYLAKPDTVFDPIDNDLLERPDKKGYYIFSAGFKDYGSSIYVHDRITVDTSGIIDTVIPIGYANFRNNMHIERLNDSMMISNSAYTPLSGTDQRNMMIRLENANTGIAEDSLIIGHQDSTEYEAFFEGLSFKDPKNIYHGFSDNTIIFNPYFGNKECRFTLLKTDDKLNIIWKKYYGEKYNTLMSILATKDGGCIMTGTRYDYVNSTELQRDIYIVKVDSNGDVISSVNLPAAENKNVKVFPNPANSNITFQINDKEESRLTIFDVTGRELYQNEFINTTFINLTGYTTGLYIYKITDSKGYTAQGKFVKE